MLFHLEDQLAQLLRDYGLIILKEPRRFKALLLDTARNAHQAEVHVLSQCVERGIPVQIQQMEQQQHHDLIINRLVQQLKDDMWLDEKRANDVIELWSRILLNKSSTSTQSRQDNAVRSRPPSISPASDAWLDELIAWADENEISEVDFPRDKQEIRNLTTLRLKDNQLTSLPESIGRLSKLRVLVIRSNQLTSLPESIGKLSNLTVLGLWGNQLTSIPESIGRLSKLTSLYLRNNQLTSVPESIGNLSKLKTLNLCSNKITDLPLSISQLTKLKMLNLVNNPIKSLPLKLRHLRDITEFWKVH